MLKYALLTLISTAAAIAADLPKLPDCISHPVTQGNLTVSCVYLAAGQVNGNADPGAVLPESVGLFRVMVTSSDPDVTGVRIRAMFATTGIDDGSLDYMTLFGTTGLTYSPDSGLNTKLYPFTYTFRTYVNYVPSSMVIEELKASSSQSF